MRRIIILWLFLWGAAAAWSQPCGLEDTLYINPNTQPVFNFEVFNIYNDDLSDPDQGVCGIEIFFVHNYIEDLVVTVTSPSNQSVELIGPNTDDPVAFTNLARWRLTFVPCSGMADPYPGTMPQWDNNNPNPWAIFGNYSGSYYPYIGCLEDFNTGPANGTWQIKVSNDPSDYPGAILGFRIIFCDERGLDCCFAAAGQLDGYDDILACAGDTSRLRPDLPPNYTGTPPDTSEYGYTYLIGEGDVLLEYDSTLDFSNFAPGLYQVCGFSYKRADLDSFPDPDGVLTIDSLRRNLDGLEPIFCGEVTDSCVLLRIVPPPDTTFLAQSICEGDSVMVGDSTLASTGLYTIGLESYAGCDSIVQLDLNVIPTARTNLERTICEGDSIVVGASIYRTTGTWVDTLTAASSCDSIVTLDLEVLAPVFFDTSLVLCRGEGFTVGDSLLVETGTYVITLPSAQGCDSIIQADIEVLDVDAIVLPPDTITCYDPVVNLDGASSSPMGSLTFRWTNPSGELLGISPVLPVNQGGVYILEAMRSQGGTSCAALDTVVVEENTTPPIADAGPADTLTCDIGQLPIGGPGTSIGDNFTYSWTASPGNLLGTADEPTAVVDEAGVYQLVVTGMDNGCRDTATVAIALDARTPIALAGPDINLSCSRPSIALDGSGSSTGPDFEYNWQSTTGIIPQDANTLMPVVTAGGTYRLLVTNTDNGCTDSAFVSVSYDTLAPQAVILPPDTLNCELQSFLLQASFTDGGGSPDFLWRALSGGPLASGTSTLMPEVDAPGAYELLIVNTENGCRDSVQVVVVETVNVVAAAAGGGGQLTCARQRLGVDAAVSSSGPDIQYYWSTPDGRFAGDSLGYSVDVNAPGTYQLIVRDTFTRCSDTALVIVTQDTLKPVADAGPDRLITCDSVVVTLDGSASSSGPDFEYDWISLSGVDVIGVNTPDPLATEPGVYLLIVTDTTNGCIDTSQVTAGLDTVPPAVQIEEPGFLNCAITSFQLDGSGSDNGSGLSFFWRASDGGQIIAGASSLSPTAGAAGRYELVVVNDSTGCRDSSFVLLRDTINEVQALAGPPGVLSCDSLQLHLSADGSTTGPDITYQWQTADGRITGDSTGRTILLDLPGTYTLITLDTFTRCADTSNLFIPIDTLPPFVEAGDGFELNCSVLQDTLNGGASDSGPGFAYRWEGPCLVGPADNARVIVDCPGTYRLVVENNATGCLAVDTVVVSRDEDVPIAVAGSGYTLTCDSTTLRLSGAGSSQGANYLYEWSGPGILGPSDQLDITVNLPGQYTLSVRDTVNTCLGTATATVGQDTAAPTANAGIVEIISCDSLSVEIGGIESSMGPDYAYQWLTPNGSIISPTDQPFVRVDSAGDYQLIVTNIINGCRDTSFTFVSDDSQPPFTEAGPPQLLDCGAPTALLDGSASASASVIQYEWLGPCLLSTPDSNQVQVGCEGTYYLTTFNTASGCSGIDSVLVSRDAALPLALLPDSIFLSCETGTVIIDGSSSIGASFEWFFNGQPAANLAGLSPEVGTPGTYSLLALNADQDCADTAIVEVLLDCTPVAVLARPDTLTCLRLSVQLDASSSTFNGPVEYQWVAPDNSCIVSGQGSPILTVRCPGEYSLYLSNIAFGLADTARVVVVADTIVPVADAGPSDTITCDEPTAVLDGSGSSSGSTISYLWTNLSETFTSTETVVTVNESGTYFLAVTDSTNGCFDEDIVIIQRSADLPVINFGNTVIPCLQDSFWLQALVNPAGQPYTYSWEGANLLGSTDSSSVLLDTAGIVNLTVVNTSNNCPASSSVEVIQQDCIPCLEIASVDSLTCLVDTVTIAASFCELCTGCVVRWSTQDGVIIGDADALEVLAGAPGTYTITATDTLGFSRVVNVPVRENRIPPVVDAGADQQLDCEKTEATLGNAVLFDSLIAYQWTALGGTLPPGEDTLATLTVDFPDTFRLQAVHRITGCVAVDEAVVVQESEPPIADAGPPVVLDCQSPVMPLDGSSSSFGASIRYQWSGPAGASIAGADSFNPLVNAPGWYYLTVTDADNGCFAIDSVQVSQEGDLPPVPALADTALNCGADVLMLSGSVPAGPYSFRWCRLNNNGMPAGPCVPLLSIDVSIPGVYRFEVEDDNTGCVNFTDVTVGEDYLPPTVDAGPDGTLLCSLDSLQLSATAGPDSAALSFQWSAQSGSPIRNANSLTPTIYQADTYTLVVTNLSNQCAASSQAVVFRDENRPTAAAGPDTSLNCSRTSLRLQGSGETASGNASYRWTTDDGMITFDSTGPMPLITSPGTYLLEVMDPQNGCTDTDTVVVTEDRRQPMAATLPAVLELNCRVDVVTADASPSASATGGGLTYQWWRLPATPLGNTVQVQLNQTGNYRLVVTDTTNGCRDSLLLSLTGNFVTPEVEIAPPLPLTCSRAGVTLDGEGSSQGSAFRYYWLGPAGDTLPGNLLEAMATAPGLYQLAVVNQDNGCADSTTIIVTADTIAPIAIIQQPEVLDCILRVADLDGTTSSSGPGISYQWSASGGGVLGAADGSLAEALAPGWYRLAVIDQNNGCRGVDSVLVEERASPIEGVDLQAEAPSCPGQNNGSVLVDSVFGGTGPFLFTLEGGAFMEVFSFENLPPGSYVVEVQDANGCEFSEMISVPEATGLTVELIPEVTIRLGDSTALVAEVSPANYDTLWWWPSEGLPFPSAAEQMVSPGLSTVYTVFVSNGAGCTVSAQTFVKVVREYQAYAPNIFSPNGDGSNDQFTLFAGPDVAQIKTLQIFDRWGDMVFENTGFPPNDPSLGWDGRLNGTEMDPAVFVYYAELEFVDGRVEVIAGDLLLMR